MKEIVMKRFLQVITTFSLVIMVFSSLNYKLVTQLDNNLEQSTLSMMNRNDVGLNQNTEIPEGFDLIGNRIQNPMLRYAAGAVRIPNWKIFATINVEGGIGAEKTLATAQSQGFRHVAGLDSNYYRMKHDNSTGSFQGKSIGGNDNRAFYLVSQTANLVQGKTYYYRAEVSASGGPVSGAMNIYPGIDAIAGSNIIKTQQFSLNGQRQIYEIPFVATQTNVTLSIRHIRNTNQNSVLTIHNVGFYLEDDYEIQDKLNNLFVNLNLENLKFDTLSNINRIISELETSLTTNASLYTQDVKDYVTAGLVTARAQRDQFEDVYDEIDSFYQSEGVLRPNVTLEELATLRESIDEVTNPAFKADLDAKYVSLSNLQQVQAEIPNLVQELEEAKAALEAEIDALSTLTEAEKQAYKDRISAEIAAKQEEATKAADLTEFNNIKDDMDVNLEAIYNEAEVQNQKALEKARLNQNAAEIRSRVEVMTDLSQTEKAAILLELNQALNAGLDAIEQMNHGTVTGSDVQTKGNEELLKLDAIELNANKLSAKNKIDSHTASIIAKMEALTNIPEEEKDDIISELEALQELSKSYIDDATTASDITTKKNETVTSMDSIYLENARQDAKNQILAYANSLTTDSARVNEVLSRYNEEINNAGSESQLRDAINNAKVEIDLAHLKDTHLATLLADKTALIARIEAMPNLTEAQKQSSINELNTVYNETVINMDNSTKDIEVNYLKDIASISNNEILLKSIRQDAKTELTAKTEALKNEINQMTDLSDEAKAQYISELEQSKQDSFSEIENGYSEETIETAKADAESDLNNVVLDAKKEAAINNLTNQANDAKAAINDLAISDEDKAAYIEEIDRVLADATTKVNNAETQEGLDTVKNNASNSIDQQKELAETQDDENFELEKNTYLESYFTRVQSAKDFIDQEIYLTAEQKQAYKDQLDALYNRYVQEVDDLENRAQLRVFNTELTNQLHTLMDEAVLENEKNLVSSLVTEKYNEVKANIEGLTGLTTEERQAKLDELLTVRDDAFAYISSETNLQTLRSNKDPLLAQLVEVYNDSVKDIATKEVMALYNEKVTKINGLTDLREQRRQELLDEAALIVKDFRTSLDTVEMGQVEAAKNNKMTLLNELDVRFTEEARTAFEDNKEDFMDELADLKESIMTDSEKYGKLTPDLQEFFNEKLTEILEKAQTDMDAVTTTPEAEAVFNQAVESIRGIELQMVKGNSILELTDFVKELMGDGLYNQTLVDQINSINQSLSDATTEADVLAVLEAGKQSITDLVNSEINAAKVELERKLKLEAVEPITEEVTRLINEALSKVTTSNYSNEERMNNLYEEYKSSINTYYELEINKVKQSIIEELGNLYHENQSDELNAILEEALNQIDKTNYLDTDFITELVGDLKTDLSEQKTTELAEAKETFRQDLIAAIKEPISAEQQAIIDEALAKITMDNYDNEDALDAIYEEAMEKVNRIIEAEVEAYKDQLEAELEAFAKDVITVEIDVIIGEALMQINKDNYKNEELMAQIKAEAEAAITESIQKGVQKAKDDLRTELEKQVGTPISPEHQAIINDAVNKINDTNYADQQALDQIKNNATTSIDTETQKQVDKVKDQVKKELEEYAKDNLTPEMQEKIKEIIDSINKDNYKDQDFLDKQKEQGKKDIDDLGSKESDLMRGWTIAGLVTAAIALFVIIRLMIKKASNKALSVTFPILFFAINEMMGNLIIGILIGIIVVEIIVIITILLKRAKRKMMSKRVDVKVIQTVHHVKENDKDLIKKYELEYENDLESDEEIQKPELNINGEAVFYNHSFDAKLHLSNQTTQQRFCDFKNYVLGYKDVMVRKSWKTQRFIFGDKTFARMWISDGSLKIYFSLNPKSVKEYKDKLTNMGHINRYQKTPWMLVVNDDKSLKLAFKIIDTLLVGKTIKFEYKPIDYKVESLSKDKLIDMKLIKQVIRKA